MTREFARWILLAGFCVGGAVVLTWAFQDADFSMPAEPIAKAMYETKAELLLPMSILFFAVGVLFFIRLGRGANRADP